jgi:hypothetical protein
MAGLPSRQRTTFLSAFLLLQVLAIGQNPSWRLLGLLALTLGMRYFLLSTTSPLLQAWYARSRKLMERAASYFGKRSLFDYPMDDLLCYESWTAPPSRECARRAAAG